jgi:hypothetical protein
MCGVLELVKQFRHGSPTVGRNPLWRLSKYARILFKINLSILNANFWPIKWIGNVPRKIFVKIVLTVDWHFHSVVYFFYLVSWGGVRLTSATNWAIVPAPNDRWWWMWSSGWNENRQGKPKYSQKTCPSSTLSTTYSTWRDVGSNPGRRGGTPATHRLSCGLL